MKIKVKVVKVGNSLRMTIPKDIVREMGLKAGDQLLVSLTDSQMLVEKQTPIAMAE
ncbi:MAG: AbrB/MazE/SpoVT family DNA-binding domain-containing protein [archaeon]|nr:AbrB/MazE/SpoVT family DNA-binding domain-containing protein [archaeon]